MRSGSTARSATTGTRKAADQAETGQAIPARSLSRLFGFPRLNAGCLPRCRPHDDGTPVMLSLYLQTL
jgi:hypothetical protein